MNFFYALEPYWLGFDRFYKVYTDDTALYGACLAGQIYDDASSAQHADSAQILSPLVSLWSRPLIRKRHEREEQYDQIDPVSPDFLKRDRRNFRILRRDILGVRLKEKRWSFWTGIDVSGVLCITTRMEGTKKFILVGKQDPSYILALLNGSGS